MPSYNVVLKDLSTPVSEICYVDKNINSDQLREVLECFRPHNENITKIDFSNNSIDDDGIVFLVAELINMPKLEEIYLAGNTITCRGVISLCAALVHNKCLTILNLVGNQIGNDGAQAIAGLMGRNTHLAKINLASNEIGNEGAASLTATLKNCLTVIQLNISRNQDDFGIIKGFDIEIKQYLERNNAITKEPDISKKAQIVKQAREISSEKKAVLFANTVGEPASLLYCCLFAVQALIDKNMLSLTDVNHTAQNPKQADEANKLSLIPEELAAYFKVNC